MPSINYVQFEVLMRDLVTDGRVTPSAATQIRGLVAGERSLIRRLSDPELLAVADLVWRVEHRQAEDEAYDLIEAEAAARGYEGHDSWVRWMDDYLEGKTK